VPFPSHPKVVIFRLSSRQHQVVANAMLGMCLVLGWACVWYPVGLCLVLGWTVSGTRLDCVWYWVGLCLVLGWTVSGTGLDCSSLCCE